jgi:hypothetical protein
MANRRAGRGPATKGATVSIRIPAHLRDQIEEKVRETGTNLSHVVETLLMQGLLFDRLAGTALRFEPAALARLMYAGENLRMSKIRSAPYFFSVAPADVKTETAPTDEEKTP